MSAGITLRGWCVWLARQFNAESTERRRARREGKIGASRGGQRRHGIAGRAAVAAGHISRLRALRTSALLTLRITASRDEFSIGVPPGARSGNANSRGYEGITQMQANRHWLRSKSVVAQAYHPCSSLLIRVHLRFHFLLPEQARNRRGGTIRDLGRNAPEHARRVQQNNQQPRPRIVTLSATDDRLPLWFGCGPPRCGLCVKSASRQPHWPRQVRSDSPTRRRESGIMGAGIM